MTDRHNGNRGRIARFLLLRSRREQTGADLLLPPPSATGVYVDIENLRRRP